MADKEITVFESFFTCANCGSSFRPTDTDDLVCSKCGHLSLIEVATNDLVITPDGLMQFVFIEEGTVICSSMSGVLVDFRVEDLRLQYNMLQVRLDS